MQERDDDYDGEVSVTVTGNRTITCSPDPVIPDQNGNISFMLNTPGWQFNPNNPINIADPNRNFSETLVSPTQLNVTDNEQDRLTMPQHNYTVNLLADNGDEASFDPVIQDRR